MSVIINNTFDDLSSRMCLPDKTKDAILRCNFNIIT